MYGIRKWSYSEVESLWSFLKSFLINCYSCHDTSQFSWLMMHDINYTEQMMNKQKLYQDLPSEPLFSTSSWYL